MLWVLRIALYIQLLLGIGRFAGWVNQPRLWETHVSLGALIVVLALIGLRPPRGAAADRLSTLARWLPLLTMAVGLYLYVNARAALWLVIVHMILGVATVGLVDAAIARRRRGERQGLAPFKR
ncbi:MAG TPA: DUF1516 family protein [Bacillota bacterium]